MEITTIHNDTNATSVVVTGEMNIYHALDGKELLMKAIGDAADVELDLSNVTEFDSSGLQLVLLAYREAERNGNRLRIKGKNERVENVIALFRLGELFGCTHQEA